MYPSTVRVPATAAIAALRCHLQPLASPMKRACFARLRTIRAPSNARECGIRVYPPFASPTTRIPLYYTWYSTVYCIIRRSFASNLSILATTSRQNWADHKQYRHIWTLPPYREPGEQATQYHHGPGRQGFMPTLFIVVVQR